MNAGDYKGSGDLKGKEGVGGCCNYPLLHVVFPVALLYSFSSAWFFIWVIKTVDSDDFQSQLIV